MTATTATRTRRFSAVLLDFYGTLVAEDDATIEGIIHTIVRTAPNHPAAREVASDWSRRFAEACAAAHGDAFVTQREIERNTLRATANHFGSSLDADAASAELFAYWSSPTPSPDSAAFLASLRVPCCIVSNIDQTYLDDAITANGWAFEHRITSECARAYKPRPEMFEQALQCLGVAADRVLHIGDSWGSDIVGAGQLGIASAWINPHGRPPRDERHTPDFTVSNLAELRDRLRPLGVCGSGS